MDVLPSAEFRKRYAGLKSPTQVTVNGHAIGIWFPGHVLSESEIEATDVMGGQLRLEVSPRTQSAQAARDDLLRKINRSK